MFSKSVCKGKLNCACLNKNKIVVLKLCFTCVCGEFWVPNINIINLISDFQISEGSWILPRRDTCFYCINPYEDISVCIIQSYLFTFMNLNAKQFCKTWNFILGTKLFLGRNVSLKKIYMMFYLVFVNIFGNT